ncbi:pyridoxamine 5'-phosphate oxidase family protein [Aeromonas bivalvium]|uniref:pyridoxamine 5'-phosphate oxidase family protein n=1 Tax=Aeromonas bivalvium TaxID=440079 RepID=UPI0038D17553
MGQLFEALSPRHVTFIEAQKIYFVGTAAREGTVNLSPKGGDSLRILGPNTLAWLNLTGSGNESAAHVLQHPRMTVMFCAFEGAPLILRAYGRARVLHRGDTEWESALARFPASVAARQVFLLDIERVQTSCGMSVPLYDYQGDREDLANWSARQGREGIEAYWRKKNQRSLDGLESEILTRSGLQADD